MHGEEGGGGSMAANEPGPDNSNRELPRTEQGFYIYCLIFTFQNQAALMNPVNTGVKRLREAW